SAGVAKRVIVVWKPGVPSPDRVAARDDASTSFVRTLGDARFQLLSTQPGQSRADALAALRADPTVQMAVPDGFDRPLSVPNDPLFGEEWGLQNNGGGIDGFTGAIAGDDVDVVPAWDRTVGTPSTVVADIDSGYRFDHPDLGPVAWTNPGDPTVDGQD